MESSKRRTTPWYSSRSGAGRRLPNLAKNSRVSARSSSQSSASTRKSRAGCRTNMQSVESQGVPRRNKADGRFFGFAAAFHPLQNPFQNANIVPVARPKKFSVRAFAKPVHMENLGRMRDALAHVQPVLEIIGHVVAAEGQHRHGIAPRDAHIARGRGGGFRSHRGAHIDAMLPVEGFVDQRSQARAAATKNKRRNGHAFGIFPLRRNAGRLFRRHGVARIRMCGGSFGGVPLLAAPGDQARGRLAADAFPPRFVFGVTPTFVKIVLRFSASITLGFVFIPVPGATPKKPASGLMACR